MTKNGYIIKIMALVFFALSCKEDIIQPIQTSKNLREMIWSIDTLKYPNVSQLFVGSMWASSSKDIYICGHSSHGGDGSLWRYDGLTWKPVNLFNYIERNAYDLNEIRGLSNDDIWIAGERNLGFDDNGRLKIQSMILHFDGVRWVEQNVKTKSTVLNIYPNRKDDVWACGEGGIIYHFNGINWTIDTIKANSKIRPIIDAYYIYDIITYNNQVYATGAKILNGGLSITNYLYTRQNSKWAVKDSFVFTSREPAKFGLSFYKTSYNKLYSYGGFDPVVFSFTEGRWVNETQKLGYSNTLFAKSENDIISAFKTITHYNGVDLKKFNELPKDVLYTGSWMDEKEAFIVGIQTGNVLPATSIILHGR